MAFEPDRVIVDNTPNRWLRLSQVLGDAIDQYQQNTRLQQQHNETVKAQVLAAFLHNPSAETYATVHAAFPNMDLGKFQESPEQQFQGKFYGNLNNTYDPTKPLNVDPIAAGMVNPKLAEAKPFMEAAGQRYTYSRPNDLPPQVVAAQETTDKLIPTGNESVVNAQNAPVKVAEAANQNAQAISHSADAAFTAGAKTTLTRAETANQSAQAGEHGAKAKAVSAFLPDSDTGAPNPAVMNAVAAVKGAVGKGIDPNVVLNKIKSNKQLYNAVVGELSKPENASILQSQINPAQRTALAEIDPLIAQAKKVAAAYEPYRNQNGLTDRDSLTYAAYMAGQKPPDDSPASELANLQMLRVQAGARLLKGGSRAYPALQMAMTHAGNGLVDTRANIYSKTMTLIEQLQRVRDSNAGTLNQPTGNNPDPLGILH